MTVFKSKKSFFVLLILVCGSCAINAQKSSKTDIRGVILKLNRFDAGAKSNKLLGSILVEREPNGSGEHDKAVVGIMNETRIYALADKDKGTPLKIDALKLN